jgi:cytidylate kinase
MSPNSDRVVSALARLSRYAESHPAPKQAPSVTIAMTRQAGSRGAEIAQAVGVRLGWPVYDRELLKRIAEEKGLSARLLERLDERCTNWLQEIMQGFSAKADPSEGTYMKRLVELLMSLAEAGHCVVVGRGSADVLPPSTTVRVRVVAPRALRVVNTEKREKMSKAEAEAWVDRTDRERSHFVRTHFNRDPNDPLNYDLVLNSGRYSTEECVQLIVQAARLLEARLQSAAAPHHTA